MTSQRDIFRNKPVSVIGAARSGLSAAHVLTQQGAVVTLSDNKPLAQFSAEMQAEIAATGARMALGATPEEATPAGTTLVVTSPGVPRTAPVLQEAVRRGIPIWSEIELAYRLTETPILATTGTNGKTTTTFLLTAMLQEAGFQATIAGNVSADAVKRTLVEAAVETVAPTQSGGSVDFLVAEISSFQLEWVEQFAPHVAILTNITPDHLNRHASFAEYCETKARIFAAQGPEDRAILNFDDSAARAIGETRLPGERCWFTCESTPPDTGPAGWLEDGFLMLRPERNAAPVALLAASEMPFTLPGTHSIQNVLAAGLAAVSVGASPEAVADAVRAFPGVAHRMEFVAEHRGVRFINNSMCTNVAAAIQSLAAMDRPTIVIAGGADKALDFAPLVPTLHAKARHVILIGSVAEKMEALFRAGGYTALTRAATLDEAVTLAAQRALPGEAVLLSPACASFDMFADFEARGAAFRHAVRNL